MGSQNGVTSTKLPGPHGSPPVLSPVLENGAGLQNGDKLNNASQEEEVEALSQLPEANGTPITVSQKHTRSRSSSLPMRDVGSSKTSGSPSQRRQTTLTPLDVPKLHHSDVLKMSPSQIFDLTTAPDSLPVRPITPDSDDFKFFDGETAKKDEARNTRLELRRSSQTAENRPMVRSPQNTGHVPQSARPPGLSSPPVPTPRPVKLSRSLSIPVETRSNRQSSEADFEHRSSPYIGTTARRRITSSKGSHRDRKPSGRVEHLSENLASSIPASIPLPPFSLPTYLQLELSTQRPSPLYIHRPSNTDIPYESSRIKFERLLNFLLLPPYLEKILLFGALTCLDSWLYTFTVLPLRFFKSLSVLLQWTAWNLAQEARDMLAFIYRGLPRMWQRRRKRDSIIGSPSETGDSPRRIDNLLDNVAKSRQPLPARIMNKVRGHRRTHPVPSTLQQNQKADLLSGLLVITGCIILSRFDASRMYHNIRGQAAIKLYVIYNVLEVCDRLFSALGQDIMECLFSQDTLERKANGRSKLLQPLWMFGLALVYTVVHATALFYQVITLNVAVNSYSNALLTLLLSNQFVEIKGTVFKKFEKENLFQLTCADVVERFQLWLMLLIIALRNIVEVGGLSMNTGGRIFSGPASSSSSNSAIPPGPNATTPVTSTFGIIPNAFTTLPSLFPFQVLTPFLLVLGSEMLVDWLKHAYITKFNATSPQIYARFLDILSKDYYTHAFADQNLTKRLGLPVIPLACLFIRAALQTYHMFLATNITAPSISTATSLTSAHTEAEPTSSPVLAQLDLIFRRALGHSSFGGGATSENAWKWTLDDGIALATMLLFFLALYLLLLALKLVLGMVLLGVARSRYAKMVEREIKGERERLIETESKRLGGWGVAELGEERREKIYEGHEGELRKLREKEHKAREREEKEGLSGRGLKGLEGVERYAMVAKRIW